MSLKPVTQAAVISSALKSPYAFLIYLGAGLYFIAGFTSEQRANISAFVELLNNAAGYAFLFFIALVLLYGLFFFPVGHFLSKHIDTAFQGVNTHFRSHEEARRRSEEHQKSAEEHHHETKILIEHVQKMAISVNQLTRSCSHIVEKFER